MRLVKPNLTTGQIGPEIYNLQEALLFLVSINKIEIANKDLLNQIACCEMESKLFGNATCALVEAYCTQEELTPGVTFLVDEDVAESINNKLLKSFKTKTISGCVLYKSDRYKKIDGQITIEIYRIDYKNSTLIETVSANESGYYQATIIQDLNSVSKKGIKGLQIKAIIDQKEFLSETKYSYGNDITINVEIEAGEIEVFSEYFSISSALISEINPKPINEIDIDDHYVVEQLAFAIGEDETIVKTLVWAARMSVELPMWLPPIFYGLLRQGMPNELERLIEIPKDLLKRCIEISIATNIIDPISPQDIDNFIDNLYTEAIRVLFTSNVAEGGVKASTFNIIDCILVDSSATNHFFSELYNYIPSSQTPNIWEYFSQTGQFVNELPWLKVSLAAATLTGSNYAISSRLIYILQNNPLPGDPSVQVNPSVPSLDALAKFGATDWLTIVTNAQADDPLNFFYPDGVFGNTIQEKNEEYASIILRNFANAFPLQYVYSRIQQDPDTPFPMLNNYLGLFIKQNPTFDFRIVSLIDLPNYNFSGIPESEEFIQEIAVMQRLMHLTTNYDVINELAKSGLKSAVQIISTPRPDFINQFAPVSGSVRAASGLYSSAKAAVHTSMLAAFAMARFDMLQFNDVVSEFPSNEGLKTGLKSAAHKHAPAMLMAFSSFTVDVYADWRNLFGALDTCNCSHCQSVYSPSAYMVDVLKFLSDCDLEMRNELLNNRRPDIKNIELTCKNTNTPIPYIDIVNELLEDIVSTTTSSGYTTYARQTTLDSEIQRASPEYINTSGEIVNILLPDGTYDSISIDSPYPTLKDAKYPWSLPYNFYKREIDTTLDIVKVKPFELSQRFSNTDILDAWNTDRYCYQYLNITQEEWEIITTTPALTDLYIAYGLKTGTIDIPDPQNRGSFISITPDNWIEVLMGRVDIFLQQTGLNYIELLQLLECYFLNPLPRNLYIRTNDTLYPDDTCELDKLEIFQNTILAGEKFRELLFRFVRISRALDWEFYELDKALTSISATDIDTATFIKLVHMKYMCTILNMSVDNICVLWNDINTSQYRDFESSSLDLLPTQYQSIFRDKLLTDIDIPSYPFPELPITSAFTQNVIETYFSGILKISGDDLSKLLKNIYSESPIIPPGTPIIPTIPFLTRVYREAILLKSLKLTVDEWLFFKQWIADISYFGSSTSMPYDTYTQPFVDTYSTLRFISFVKLVKNTNTPTSMLDYILRDKPNDTISDNIDNNNLADILTKLRYDLFNAWNPEYNPTTDIESDNLNVRLQKVMDASQASQLVNIIERTSGTISPIYTAADADFLSGPMAFLLPTSSLAVLIEPSSSSYIPTTAERRLYVYNILYTYVRDNILKQLIVNNISRQFSLDDSITFLLLDSCITIPTTTGSISGFEALLDSNFILSNTASSPSINRWDTDFYKIQFNALLLLQKASLLVNKFGLSITDVTSIWVENVFTDIFSLSDLPIRISIDILPAPSAGLFMPVTFKQIENLLRWMVVRVVADSNMPILYSRLQTLTTSTKLETDTDIKSIFSLSDADTTELLGTATGTGILGATFYSDYARPQLYLRIIDCLELQHLLPATMHDLVLASTAVNAPTSQTEANTIIQLVRSQYSSKNWLSVIRPVSDKTRVERRDALLAYLLYNPPYPYQYQWYTINDIYSTLMVDVQMMSCMNSSRIALAISTIQLWVDRILLGLEQTFNPSTGLFELLKLRNEEAREWATWRKLYRVWEANRKVYIYPENYILPELRDNKSPEFQEVVDFLNQNDLNNSNIEDAYTNYLEKLEEIAHLEIAAMYRETKQHFSELTTIPSEVVHVIGRSQSLPRKYYYRKRVDNVWTAWEKMNIQVESDHHVAVMWRGRLRLYWLMFNKEEASGPEAVPGGTHGAYTIPPPMWWSTTLHWSELKNGNWTPPQSSKNAVYSFPMNEASPQSLAEVTYFQYPVDGIDRIWYLKGAMEQAKKNIYFYSQITDDGDLTLVVQQKVIRNSAPYMNHLLTHEDFDFSDMIDANEFGKAIAILENSDDLYRDKFPHQLGVFYHKHNGIIGRYEMISYTMFFRLYYFGWHKYQLPAAPYRYVASTDSGYHHYPDYPVRQLIKRAPDVDISMPSGKYIMFPMNSFPGSIGDWDGSPKIIMPYFFYKDYKNLFFVEKVVKYVIIPVTPSDFGTGYVFYTGYDKIPISTGVIVPILVGGVAGYPYGTVLMEFPLTYYKFNNYYHNKVVDFRAELYKNGLEGLINRQFLTDLPDKIYFNDEYQPTGFVYAPYTTDMVDYDYDGAYSLYNWELFFHIPILIANKLTQNQQFAEARKWYHFVFDPTSGNNTTVAEFWNFSKFYDESTSIPTPMEVITSPDFETAITVWEKNPFNPHLIARTRISAYMKNTLMNYIDNLIAWGDFLFSQNTAETINEATQLYVLASQLLGRKPDNIPTRATPSVQTFDTLASAGLNAFSNALINIETLLLPSGITTVGTSSIATTGMYYFCLIPNDKLLAYWGTLSDRLFKIRHCMTIDGVVQDIPLFAPPIDPAILVNAAASGMSLESVVAALNAPLPYYRFNVMVQKANELIQEVKSLGGALLSALEKKDAEYLALLRNTQELSLLDEVTALKEDQIKEATEQLESLKVQLASAEQRIDYYQGLLDGGLNASEQLQLNMYSVSMFLHSYEAVNKGIASVFHILPQIKLSILDPATISGGHTIGSVFDSAAGIYSALATISTEVGGKAGIRGGYDRRDLEWSQQQRATKFEKEQLTHQMNAATIKLEMANIELKNHKLQIKNVQEIDTTLRTKFTNQELYNWMISQISGIYFLAYRLANDTAQKAEKAYRNELSLDTSNFIQYGYWNSLKKGLLAGEKLGFDIKRMEMSYMDLNKRRYEMSKNISLASLDPNALLLLRINKSCIVTLPEWLYDLDYPGQYMRRIKSVSISIPSVAGPYTTISCKLTLLNSRYRKNTSLTSGYPENLDGDSRFNYIFGNVQSITTSNAQNDSGVFELNFRDERYIPFEGAGAISTWSIELPPAYAQFDYNSISDVILHVKYTAFDDGSLASAASTYLGSVLDGTSGSGNPNLFRLFSLRSEFANEWHQMLYNPSHLLILNNIKNRMPYLAQAGSLNISTIEIYSKPGLSITLQISSMVYTLTEVSVSSSISKYTITTPGFSLEHPWQFSISTASGPVTPTDIKDAWMVLYYTV